jgi:hypothetical protein
MWVLNLRESVMSENTQTEQVIIDLDAISPELKQVIEFDAVPEAMHGMVISIHEVSEDTVREAWDTLPNSAQNVLDNFEQFHALISVSQAFAGVSVMEEFPNLKLPTSMNDHEKEEYRAQLLDQTLHNCVKDMLKQIKKARRDPILKRDFKEVFVN